MIKIIEKLVWEYLWGIPLIVTILGTGFYLTFFSGFFQIRKFDYSMKESFKRFFRKDSTSKGTLSPLEAVSISIGATIGVGNIGGVATAIAFGGPGAVFWLWLAGLIGQIIKMEEITLAVHYRSIDENGEFFGGPAYYINRGIGKEKRMNGLSKLLNFIFIFGFISGFIISMQNYTVSEAISSTFNLNMIVISIIYTILLYIMISGGIPMLGKIATIIVPCMCIFYLIGGCYIIFSNFALIPSTFDLIFKSAFTGTAAVGGFGGAAFAQVIKVGMSRAVYSNEAGWGTSPMIHASAKTEHPIKQGLLGIFEVFVDTMVICTITSLIIIITGQWSSGLDGAALTLSAFESQMGSVGRIILTAGILFFGLTTSSGLYAEIEILLRYIFKTKIKYKNKILKVYKWIYPLPGLALVLFAVYNGLPGITVWLFADMSSALPIFANILALLILSPKFFSLLKDFNLRYLKKRKVDTNYKVFYTDKK